MTSIAFGPILSRRFGRSLGVNNIPSKHCTYSCVYCQVGPTPKTETVRMEFYDPAAVAAAVERKLSECTALRQPVDVISFVPDGEPTLDVNLGEEISRVKRLGLPVAVITNGSLLSLPDVRADLAAADIVSIEIDSVDEHVWRRLDRPSPQLELGLVLDGMLTFSREYRGSLWTQTMLIAGVNDTPDSADAVAAFVSLLAPARACISVPTRPPADIRVATPAERSLMLAKAVFASRFPDVEMLPAAQKDAFVPTGDPAADLLAALAVHPMREDAVARDVRPGVIDSLVAAGRVQRVTYGGATFLTKGSPALV